MFKNGFRYVGAIVAAQFLLMSPAAAERVFTFWQLEPTSSTPPTIAAYDEPFFEQRMLPIKLVKLSGDAKIGNQIVRAGTPLYLVFNASQKIGYCTYKDRSFGRGAMTLFIPVADQRPCFYDSDNDGRFDKTFSVFDSWGGIPAVRGSIDGANLLQESVPYESGDIRESPDDLRISLKLIGSKKAEKAQITLHFSRNIPNFEPISGQILDQGSVFEVINLKVHVQSVEGGIAKISSSRDADVYVSSSGNRVIYWDHLPSWVVGN